MSITNAARRFEQRFDAKAERFIWHHAFAQQVQPDGIGQHMVVLQNRDAVLDRPLDFAVGVLGQHFLYIFNGSGSTFFLIDFFAQ